MNLATGIEPVTILKTKSSQLIRKARLTKQPIVITQNGKPSAVLLDIESYQRQKDALLLMKFILQGEEDYRKGRVVSHAKAQSHIASLLSELKDKRG